MEVKKVCWFGFYDPSYSRNRVLMAGFRQLGWEIIECRIESNNQRWLKYWHLWQAGKQAKQHSPTLVIVAFPGQLAFFVARLIFGRQVILDTFVSLYNSEIEDRQKYSRFSLVAVMYFLLDYLSSRLAWRVLLDTQTHIDYFVTTFKLPRAKFCKVFVSTTPDVFYPLTKTNNENFIVHFHGSNIPLQGVEVIIKAAKILESEQSIKFRIVGPFADLIAGSNVSVMLPVPLEKLNLLLAEASIVLGIFGITKKATMVIPNKVFEALACKRPVITADTIAIHELLTDGKDVILCKAGDPESLAKAIQKLYHDQALADKLANNAYVLFQSDLEPKKIVTDLIANLLFVYENA